MTECTSMDCGNDAQLFLCNQCIEAIKARVKDCSTYNFGMRNADRLAHEDAPKLIAALEAIQRQTSASETPTVIHVSGISRSAVTGRYITKQAEGDVGSREWDVQPIECRAFSAAKHAEGQHQPREEKP